MPGTISHDRQYTSTYFTPFRFYSVGGTDVAELPIIDFTPSESANNNEILIIPYTTANVSGQEDEAIYSSASTEVSIDLYGLMPVQVQSTSGGVDTVNMWVKLQTLTATDGQILKINGLFATQYKLYTASNTITLNASNGDMNKTGGQSYIIQQTYPKKSWGEIVKNGLYTSETLDINSDLSDYGGAVISSTDLEND